MKAILKTIALAALVAPFAANACPSLAGNYNCSAYGGIVQLQIPVTESMDGRGVVTYMVDGAPIVADGAVHQAQVLPSLLSRYINSVNYQAACGSNQVQFTGQGKLVKTGEDGTVNGVLTQVGANQLTIQMVLNSAKGAKNIEASCVKN